MADMDLKKTIAPVVDRDLCHGCGTCVASCPLNAIELTRDDRRGIYRPQIDFTICNHCAICRQVCPGESVDFDELNTRVFSKKPENYLLGVYLNCYAGYATDTSLRYNGASGGVVTALLLSALELGLINGALVTRMNERQPLEPEPFIARTGDDIISAAKSKYCPVPANIALREIMEKEGRYAVVGLPCHLHGIRKFEQVNQTLARRIILHIGIFCGYTYSFLATDFLLWRHGLNQADVTALTYCGEGWPGGGFIDLSDGTRLFIPTFELYKTVEYTFAPRRCLLCCDGAAELADLACGDAWLPEFADDTAGTSVVMSRTPQGEALLGQVTEKGWLELKSLGAAKVLASQPDFINKKTHIRLYFRLAKILRQGTPGYTTRLGRMTGRDFLNAAMRALMTFWATKRSLWRFIPVLHRISRSVTSAIPGTPE